MSEIKILVVDDSREIREFVIQYILKPNDFQVVEATNGTEAMQVLLKEEIHLMLLDLEMPQMDGLEVLDELYERKIEIPVILMTYHGSEAIAVEVFRKGVRDYVIKPFTPEEVLSSIERALREVRLQRAKEALTERLKQSKKQLERRLRELQTLFLIGKSVTALLEQAQLMERIVDAALYITSAEESAVFLKDEDTNALREHVRKRRIQREERVSLYEREYKMATEALQRGEPVKTGALLCIPLKAGERTTGVLAVKNKITRQFFSEHDQGLLMALADYATIAIENARLLKQTEEAKEREKQQIRSLFERYVAPSVVEKLIARPDLIEPGGVRQEATVLFADIRDFSNFSARVTSKILMEVLNQHIAVAAEAILAERGTLDKFLGDAVMAYFNAPLPQPDHALRAVRAAWRIKQRIQEVHHQLPSAHRLQFGIGISTGEVLLGNVGAAQLMSFTVIGDTVNVSRRLQENAQAGQILICRRVHELVHKHVETREVDDLKLKGHDQPETIFEVTAV